MSTALLSPVGQKTCPVYGVEEALKSQRARGNVGDE